MADIKIAGSNGFYGIVGCTEAGEAWMRENVQNTDAHGFVACDDTRMTEDIADGALQAGLEVLVNERVYMGGGCVQGDGPVIGKVPTDRKRPSSVTTRFVARYVVVRAR